MGDLSRNFIKAVFGFLTKFDNHPAPQQLEQEPLTITTQKGLTYQFNVENARTRGQWETGLMYRHSLPENSGMLFTDVIQKEREIYFWMKNTYLSLDILFIRKDGTIHNIISSAKPCDKTYLYSNGPVVSVLELNAGTAAKLEIKPGDKVNHRFFTASGLPQLEIK